MVEEARELVGIGSIRNVIIKAFHNMTLTGVGWRGGGKGNKDCCCCCA